MVKVLANGDIVPDDDPRASGRSNVSSSSERNRPRQVKLCTPANSTKGAVTVFTAGVVARYSASQHGQSECLKTAHHRTSQIYGHNCTAHHFDRTAHHSV